MLVSGMVPNEDVRGVGDGSFIGVGNVVGVDNGVASVGIRDT